MSSRSKVSQPWTRTTPSVAAARRTTMGIRLRRSTRPVRLTTPSRTSTSTRAGSTSSSCPSSSSIAQRISSSGRVSGRSRSPRLTMPTSRPEPATTGRRFIPAACIRLAASVTVACGSTLTAGLVITAPAVAGGCPSASGRPSPSRSASQTTPSTRSCPSTTGRALRRRSASNLATCLTGVVGWATTTSIVMTSWTRAGMALLLATLLTRHPSHGQTPDRPSSHRPYHACSGGCGAAGSTAVGAAGSSRPAVPRPASAQAATTGPLAPEAVRAGMPPAARPGRSRLGKAPFCGQVPGAAPCPPPHHPGQAHHTNDQHAQDQGEQRRPQEHAAHQQHLLTRSGGAW